MVHPHHSLAGALTALLLLALTAGTSHADPSTTTSDYIVRPEVELGGIAVLYHHAQFGRDGTSFNFVQDGGQDNLFFAPRLSVNVEVARRHAVTFLYQPLQLDTRTQLPSELRLDEATFEAGTPMRFKYGFPYYRISYLYQLIADEDLTLGLGASAQIRNATIEFANADGSQLKSYRDIGFVPLLKARLHYWLGTGVFFGAEIDGIYAPIRGANGSDNEVTGALLDASVRLGLALPQQAQIFLSLRYVGGGATGQGDPEPFSDGYTKNWIHLLNVSIGGNITAP